MSDIIPVSDLPLVEPTADDFIVGSQLGAARRFPAGSLPTVADAVRFPDPVAPTYLKTVSDIISGLPVSLHRFIPPPQLAAIRGGTSSYDCGDNIREAFLETGLNSIYIPEGLHNFSGNLDRGFVGEVAGLHLRGESQHHSILRCVGAGGIRFNGGFLDGTTQSDPVLDLSTLTLQAAVANAGNAVFMTYDGGSGTAPLGPTWKDVIFSCRDYGEYWNIACRGNNVRNMHIERPTLAGVFDEPGWPAIYRMSGFVMDGDDDPVELWFTGLYAYYLDRVIDIGGHYEGIYVDSMHTVACQHGIRWQADVPNPVIMVQDSYIATALDGVDLDRVSYFRLQNNVFNPTQAVPFGNYTGIKVRRSVGDQTQASDIMGNSFIGVGMSGYSAFTETGVLLDNANSVSVHNNTTYDMDVGVKGIAGAGNRIGPNNRYVSVTTPEDVPAAMRFGNVNPELVFKASRTGGNQSCGVNTSNQIIFDNVERDDRNYYNAATGALTPAAGHYRVTGQVRISDAVIDDFLGVYINVDGTDVKLWGIVAPTAGLHFLQVSGVVEVNGAQPISIRFNPETGAAPATRTVFAQAASTRFEVEAIG